MQIYVAEASLMLADNQTNLEIQLTWSPSVDILHKTREIGTAFLKV